MNQLSALILFFTLLAASQTTTTLSAPNPQYPDHGVDITEPQPSNHSRGARKFVASVYGNQHGRRATCDKYPRVCHVKGSPGRDCCRKRCVDVRKDRLNCGMCGNKCRYPETCCRGRCVNPLHDRKNCGGCGNRCARGSVCNYGMCSYA